MKAGLFFVFFICGSLIASTTAGEAKERQDARPVPIQQPPPEYPKKLRKERVEGTVLVEFLIGPEGNVLSARTISSPDPRLNPLAEDAVLKWTFKPGLKDGKPITVRARQTITFRFDENK